MNSWKVSSKGDESWIYEYDFELKSQSREWKQKDSPRPEKITEKQIKNQSHVDGFIFDCHGIVLHEFARESQTVDAGFYVEVLKRASRATGIVGREAMDSPPRQCSPAHSALIVREFLARNSITVLGHPPYSPDLASCDFLLFPKCKLVQRGRHLGDVTTINPLAPELPYFSMDNVRVIYTKRSKFVKNEHARYTLGMKKR